MAGSASSSPATREPNPQLCDSGAPNPFPNQHDSAPPPAQSQSSTPASTPLTPNPNPNPPLASTPLPPPPPISYAATAAAGPPQSSALAAAVHPPSMPSFRPLHPQPPQFSSLQNNPGAPIPNYQKPGIPPPAAGGATAGAVPMMPYQVPQGMRPFAPMVNGYATPAGIPRYPPLYGTMVRPVYPQPPPGAINVFPVSRPPFAGIPAVRPIIPPAIRPMVAPSVSPAEKPQATVYVGRIAPTVDNEFMLSLLQLCGTVKSWKRPQDLSSGTPKGFGLCEFESDEGVLRALRLLTKLNIDGQELIVNVNQTFKEYLEKYVRHKTENSKKKDIQVEGVEEDDEGAQPSGANDNAKPDVDQSNKEDNDSGNKESDVTSFGIVTDEDREADLEALEKIADMIEERLKNGPVPPPALPTEDGSVNLTSVQPAKSIDGDCDLDTEAAEDKHEKGTNSDDKPTSGNDRPDSPDRRHDRKSRERGRGWELEREKDRELERYEREAERERIRKEREQRRRVEVAERQYEACLKEWEYREREKEKERQSEKEREKERERKRRKEILYDEEDEDEDSRKRWRRSVFEEKRKKRLREKEDDLADRKNEMEEIAEAKKRAEEDQQQKLQRDALKLLSDHGVNGGVETMAVEDITNTNEVKSDVDVQDTVAAISSEVHIGDGHSLNGINEKSSLASVAPTDAPTDAQSSGNASIKKLGFGLVGSGKRTTVPSFFHDDEDDDAYRDRKLRPLVPIDYSTEELQAVQPTASGNLAAAAEFAKLLSSANCKEERLAGERDRSKRFNEKSNHQDRDRTDEYGTHNRDEMEKNPGRDRDRDHGLGRPKSSDNRKLLDAKQLIDMIPKTKEELFSYEIDWAVYDKHQLHERMRPWISKKVREFLGEEESSLIEYIVAGTQEHVKASLMLERLQLILDEEAEMFVLKMWRMLIFEIKKVETGLGLRSKS